MNSLHIVTAHADRRVRRFVGVTPLLTARRILRDQPTRATGVLPSLRPQARDAPSSARRPQRLGASPGGRHLALTTLDRTEPASRDRQWLADLKTGAVRPIEIAGAEIIGWLAPDRLALHTYGELLVLDPALTVERRIRIPPLANAIASGADVFAHTGRSLYRLRTDDLNLRRVGQLPPDTWLSTALR